MDCYTIWTAHSHIWRRMVYQRRENIMIRRQYNVIWKYYVSTWVAGFCIILQWKVLEARNFKHWFFITIFSWCYIFSPKYWYCGIQYDWRSLSIYELRKSDLKTGKSVCATRCACSWQLKQILLQIFSGWQSLIWRTSHPNTSPKQ